MEDQTAILKNHPLRLQLIHTVAVDGIFPALLLFLPAALLPLFPRRSFNEKERGRSILT